MGDRHSDVACHPWHRIHPAADTLLYDTSYSGFGAPVFDKNERAGLFAWSVDTRWIFLVLRFGAQVVATGRFAHEDLRVFHHLFDGVVFTAPDRPLFTLIHIISCPCVQENPHCHDSGVQRACLCGHEVDFP